MTYDEQPIGGKVHTSNHFQLSQFGCIFQLSLLRIFWIRSHPAQTRTGVMRHHVNQLLYSTDHNKLGFCLSHLKTKILITKGDVIVTFHNKTAHHKSQCFRITSPRLENGRNKNLLVLLPSHSLVEETDNLSCKMQNSDKWHDIQ